MKGLYQESGETYQEVWQRYFQDNATELTMYKVFSTALMEKEMTSIYDCTTFGREYEAQLVRHYCEEVHFEALYPEEKGKVFTANPIGETDQLHEELKTFKRHVFRNFLRKENPTTKKPWSSKDVVMELLNSKDESMPWASPESPLRYIMRSYLSQIVVSCDVERLMSTFVLYDSKLNQTSKSLNVEQSVIIAKETPDWNLFDAEGAATLWRLMKPRKKQFPPMGESPLAPAPNKFGVKPSSVLKAGHEKRKADHARKMKGDDSQEFEKCRIEESRILTTTDEEDEESEDESDDEAREKEPRHEGSTRQDEETNNEDDDVDDDDEDEKLNTKKEEIKEERDVIIEEETAMEEERTDKKIETKRKIPAEKNVDAISPKKSKKAEMLNTKKHKDLLKQLHSSMEQGLEDVCRVVLKDLKHDIEYAKKGNSPSHDNAVEHDYSNSLIPPDSTCSRALKSSENGNCFFNSLSILKIGDESAASLLRLVTSAELFLNAELYRDHPALTIPLKQIDTTLDVLFPDMLAIKAGQNEWYTTKDQAAAIRKEAIAMSNDKAYVPLVAFLGAANVLNQNIRSVYPDVYFKHRQLFHQLIEPFEHPTDGKPTLEILWTRCASGPTNQCFKPNHFVPLLP